jgi:ferredoxin, 2Fe-2S
MRRRLRLRHVPCVRLARLGGKTPRDEMEEAMLENAWQPRQNSRLSCQIPLTAELEGMEVTVPDQQG